MAILTLNACLFVMGEQSLIAWGHVRKNRNVRQRTFLESVVVQMARANRGSGPVAKPTVTESRAHRGSKRRSASRRFKFTRHPRVHPRSLLDSHGVSMGCPPLLQRPSALQDVCARTHDIGSHLVSLYDPAHHLAGVGSFVDTSAVAAQSPGRAARSACSACSAPSRAQVCGCLQPCLGH
jgi:hypothetical protein